MRIDIVGSGIPCIQNKIGSLHSSINSTITSLRQRSDALSDVPGGTGRISYGQQCTNGLSSAISGIKAREQEETHKLEAVEQTSTDVRALVNHAQEVDEEVSRTVRENQDKFLQDNPHLVPQKLEEKPWWQVCIDKLKDIGNWIGDTIKAVKDWIKAHPIIVGTVMILVSSVIIVLTGGFAALGALAVIGHIAATFAALTAIAAGIGVIGGVISKIQGKDFMDGFKGGYMFAANAITEYATGRLVYAFARHCRVMRHWKAHSPKNFKDIPRQDHHIFTNKGKKMAPGFRRKIKKNFGYDINDEWNIMRNQKYHRSHHSFNGPGDFNETYHGHVQKLLNQAIKDANKIAPLKKKGGLSKLTPKQQMVRQKIFQKTVNNLKREIHKNPDMLYKYYWNDPNRPIWNFFENIFAKP